MEKIDKKDMTGIAALLIHAAKIDENLTKNELVIIKSFIERFGNDLSPEVIFEEAKKMEGNSNQLLDFTNLIKKKPIEFKKEIIKELWNIIISDNTTDEYESNLMRRICGLIYFSDKLSGEIKLALMNKV